MSGTLLIWYALFVHKCSPMAYKINNVSLKQCIMVNI